MSLTIRVSTNEEELGQYYALRERCFRDDLGLSGFDGSEEELDRRSKILLISRAGECLGGARISPHLVLPSAAEPLHIDARTTCMWERFAIDPGERSLSLVRAFCAEMAKESLASGYDQAMVLSSLKAARLYRRSYAQLGVEFQIHRNVPHSAMGAFAGLEHYLSIAYLGDSAALQVAV